MRLLAPTRRTQGINHAKSGVLKASNSSSIVNNMNNELAELRRLIAEYTNEYNAEVKRLNALKLEHEKLRESINANTSKLVVEYAEKERELSIKISSLEESVKRLEKSADATRYKVLNESLEKSIKEAEQERENLRIALQSVDESKQSIATALIELEEREQVLSDSFEQLSDAKNKLELAKKEANEDISKRINTFEQQEQKAKVKELDIFNIKQALDARERSISLFEDQLAKRNDELGDKERLIADRKAKLDSLINHYERKTR